MHGSGNEIPVPGPLVSRRSYTKPEEEGDAHGAVNVVSERRAAVLFMPADMSSACRPRTSPTKIRSAFHARRTIAHKAVRAAGLRIRDSRYWEVVPF